MRYLTALFILLLLINTTCRGDDTCHVVLPGHNNHYGSFLYDTCINNKQIDIPVIFHVVYRNSKQNICPSTILAELNDLSKDFLMLNADVANIQPQYAHLAANPNIRFYLATDITGPTGEKGIIRKKRKWRYQQPHKTSPVIQQNKYLNVYIYAPLLKKHSGHTLSRCWESCSTDAIYLNYALIGKRSRLLTHETGHWLGLMHLFAGGCDIVNDGIADTPPQAKAADPDFNIITDNNTSFGTNCNGSPCMYHNFMDYSLHRKMFTAGQVQRMRIILFNHRSSMLK